ncbi:MAG TPA: hypothetical protein VHQ23_07290 [Ilumatobacteraceae bacterium]|nr:hypothetical protein [Ilumatobacteraceae bacterium]
MAAIVALGSACLAGSPLYLSSVATAAVHSELGHICLADVSLQIPMGGAQPDTISSLENLASKFSAHTDPSVLTRIAESVQVDLGQPDVKPFRVNLLYRDDQENNLLRPMQPLTGDDQVLAPEWMNPPAGTKPGDVLHLFTEDSQGDVDFQQEVHVADTYPLVPTRPESSYWCGLRSYFRSPGSDPADPPTPALFTTSRALRVAQVFRIALWEVRPKVDGLSRHDAAVLADHFDEVVADADRLVDIDEHLRGRTVVDGGPLRLVVKHAGASAAVVAGTMAPVRLVALLSSVALLGAATALLARERQRELRLRLLKGQSPRSLGLRVARSAVSAVVVGTLAGGLLAVLAVRYLGPASEFETAAVREALIYTLIGSVVAFFVIAFVAAARARTFVDARLRHRSWVRLVPWELIPVAAAIAAFSRLDRIGGIQQVGAVASHADFWAQCFPLLAIIAPLALLARPSIALLRHWRLAGKRLPPSALTGLRRSLAEPGVTVAVLLATALAAGSFTVARLLTDSTSVLLAEKAAVYLGSDLTMTTPEIVALPPPFDAHGTVVARAQGHSGAQSVDLLGVDRATFANAVHWRDDASDKSLDELLTDITPTASGPIPAIVVGGSLDDTHLESLIRHPMDIDPVASARWFPGFRNGAVLVVIDRDTLAASGFTPATEILLRDPPPDAFARLSDSGLVVRNPHDPTLVFNVTSFLTVHWAYATLSILGVLIGIVVLLAQLLVLDARRQTRQAAHVLTTRMGLSSGGEAIGLVAELGPALVIGATLGVVIGWLVTRVSIARLDSLRHLAPPARVVAHAAAGAPVLVGVLGSLAILVIVGFVMIKRTRPMEVMRGTA